MQIIDQMRILASDVVKGGVGFGIAGVRARISKTPFETMIPGGYRVTVRGGDSDFETIRQVFLRKEYDLANQSVRRRLKAFHDEIVSRGKTPVIIDAGANIGAAALWFKSIYPQAVIVSIEPETQNVELLRRNTRDVPGIVVAHAAIGSTPGFVSVKLADTSWGVQTERSDTGEGCPIITVDQALAMVDNGELFIVKIDIEGFEKDLFSADDGWIDSAKCVSIEPHDWMLPGQGTSRTFQAAFGQRDFELFLKGENIIYVRRA